MNNDKLDERRFQLMSRLITARLYLIISLSLTLVNLLSVIIKFGWIRMPYGIELVYFLFETGIEDGFTRPGKLIVCCVAAAIIFGLYVNAVLKMKKNRRWTVIACALFIIDLVGVLILAAISFGYNADNVVLNLLLYLVNIALHLYVLVFLLRAKRAQYGLAVLPEKEIDEGDPFDEFKRPEDDESDNGSRGGGN